MVLYSTTLHGMRQPHKYGTTILKGWIKLISKPFHFLVSLNLKGYMAFTLPSGEEK